MSIDKWSKAETNYQQKISCISSKSEDIFVFVIQDGTDRQINVKHTDINIKVD